MGKKKKRTKDDWGRLTEHTHQTLKWNDLIRLRKGSAKAVKDRVKKGEHDIDLSEKTIRTLYKEKFIWMRKWVDKETEEFEVNNGALYMDWHYGKEGQKEKV